ncbi:MAG: HlyD family secretion protein [Polyangiaceae bacterium]|nr:HlyD family secretion protein [Polyangiaceae bacterium]
MTQEEPSRAPEEGPAPKRPRRVRELARQHPRAAFALAVTSVLALGLAVALWLRHEASFESTDDAQIDAHISAIGSRVAGTVLAVHVEDNQHVQPGDVLVEFDPNDYRVAVDQASANLEQAESERRGGIPGIAITDVTNRTAIATAQKDVASAQADLAGAERDYEAATARLREDQANGDLARVDLERSQKLLQSGAVAQADLDQHKAAADARANAVAASQAGVESSRHRVDDMRAKLGQAIARSQQVNQNAPKQLEQSNADVDARAGAVDGARAALEQARLNLGYTRVRAPVGGIVGQRAANIGDRVQPGQPLLAIVQTDDLWVTANFKETQLEHMRPEQRAEVEVDALGGQKFHGTVESLPGASGARFSLLPPENATGNYVKVVQRLPVRVRLESGQPNLDRLRPGMSVVPTVWIR